MECEETKRSLSDKILQKRQHFNQTKHKRLQVNEQALLYWIEL